MAESSSQSNGRRDRQADADRVEQKLEDLGGRVGRFLASAAARAREEAEDIWAEAQSIRRGQRK